MTRYTIYEINCEFDSATPLPLDKLPTNLQVLNNLRFIRSFCNRLDSKTTLRDSCQMVVNLYKDLELPVQTERVAIRTFQRMSKFASSKKSAMFLKEFYDQTFRVGACVSRMNCKCDKSSPYYQLNKDFLEDQYGPRRMTIQDFKAAIDLSQSSIAMVAIRELYPLESSRIIPAPAPAPEEEPSASPDPSLSGSFVPPEPSDDSPDFPHRNYNKHRMPISYKLGKDFGLSTEQCAAFANAVLLENGVIEDKTYCSLYKFRNEERLYKENYPNLRPEGIVCLQFDGTAPICPRFHEQSRKENIMVLSELPGNKLISTIFSEANTADDYVGKMLRAIRDLNSAETISRRQRECGSRWGNINPYRAGSGEKSPEDCLSTPHG